MLRELCLLTIFPDDFPRSPGALHGCRRAAGSCCLPGDDLGRRADFMGHFYNLM